LIILPAVCRGFSVQESGTSLAAHLLGIRVITPPISSDDFTVIVSITYTQIRVSCGGRCLQTKNK